MVGLKDSHSHTQHQSNCSKCSGTTISSHKHNFPSTDLQVKHWYKIKANYLAIAKIAVFASPTSLFKFVLNDYKNLTNYIPAMTTASRWMKLVSCSNMIVTDTAIKPTFGLCPCWCWQCHQSWRMPVVISPPTHHGHVHRQCFHAEVDLTTDPGDHLHRILNKQPHYSLLFSASNKISKQKPKLANNKYERYYWTRKVPACLLTLLCHYGKPQFIYSSLCSTNWVQSHWLQHAAVVLVKVHCEVLNRQHEMNFANYSLIRK